MDTNELYEIKQRISTETGVPIELLDGENEEENRSRALALLAYRNDHCGEAEAIRCVKTSGNAKRRTPAEQFADWLNLQLESKRII